MIWWLSYIWHISTMADRITDPMHTNFKLDRNGEYLALYDDSYPRQRRTEFSSDYPIQLAYYTYGRVDLGDTGTVTAVPAAGELWVYALP